MTTLFGQSPKPPDSDSPFATPGGGENPEIKMTLETLSFLQSLWSWVSSGYVIIPCDVGGTADAIELTPRFRPENGASGYVDLLMFSFIATATSTGAATITVLVPSSVPAAGLILTSFSRQTTPLAALPVYAETTPVGAGDIVKGVPYVAFYCPAQTSPTLPERMVRK